MASSLIQGPKLRSLTSGAVDALRGHKFVSVPDFFVSYRFAAADLAGANSGFWVFEAPSDVMFIGAQVIWAVAGTNTARLKKVLSAATSAPGAAADANNVDVSAAIALDGSANVRRDVAPVTTNVVNLLAEGDKLALASAAGTASLAGGLIVVQLAWV